MRALIEQAHDEAYRVISENRDILDHLARELIEKETLDHDQLAAIFADVKQLDERPQWLWSDNRPISDLPPIDFPKAPIDPEAVDGGVDSDSPTAPPKRAPRPRKNPGIATA